MPRLGRQARKVLAHPGAFAAAVLKGFRRNQGLLLAGAVAYYALLSLVPMLIVVVMALSHFFDQGRVLQTLAEYLDFVAPGQAGALLDELRAFLTHRDAVGVVLLVTLLFFSALAFTVLENAMSVIFHHRVRIRRRHFLVSAVMPYLFILFLGAGLLIVTIVSGALHNVGERDIVLFGAVRSLDRFSAALLYVVGVAGEALLLTAIYLVMPVGRIAFRHALVGGIAATVLWEITRRVLVWYLTAVSQIRVVYGSFTTAVLVLLSVEIGAILLLLGAQVISEYERIGREPIDAPHEPLKT